MKNLRIEALCFLILLMMSIISYGQDANYTPTTPEVASLGKFVETPVGYYSGIPNISIPIHTLTEGELSIPVSLNYHAGGIKVEETASWVGLGWNLSAGGSITRVVRGIPDDDVGGFLNNIETVANFQALDYINDNFEILDLIDRSLDGELDYQPDLFHFNIPGHSGSFFFKQSGEIVLMPHSDINIIPIKNTYDEIIGWHLKSDDGTNFYLGQSKDLTRTAYERLVISQTLINSKNITHGYINGWYLLDIENANEKKNIKLTYNTSTHETCSRSGQERLVNGSSAIAGLNVNEIRPIAYYTSTVQSSKISLIETSNEKLIFSKSSSPRLDMPDDYALEEIIVKDQDDLELKKFKLTYEDVQSNSSPLIVLCSGDERYHRMFLKSIQEFSGTEKINPYAFSYNTTSLPERFSFAQDFWGFYNGEHGNSNLIPSITVSGTRFEGADRYADPSYSVAGVLEKVTYPTGGSTEYVYEGNTSGQLSFAGAIAPRVKLPLAATNTTEVLQQSPPIPIKIYSETFNIDPALYLDAIVYVSATFPCDVSQQSCGISATFRKSDNTFTQLLSGDEQFSTLQAGEYVLEIELRDEDSDGIYPDIDIEVYGEELDMVPLLDGVNYAVGGLRIKNIKKHESNGVLAFERTFDYNLFGNPNSSSGSITSRPLFVLKGEIFKEVEPYGGGAPAISLAAADFISSTSNSPFTTTQSNYVGYSNVTEYLGTTSSNSGKNEYEFSFALDDDSKIGVQAFAYSSHLGNNTSPPPTVFEWLRGNLKESRSYLNNAGNYELIRSQVNEYIYYNDPSDNFYEEVKGIKFGKRIDFGTFEFFETRSEWFKLDHSITTDYYDGHSTVTRVEYTYNEDETKHIKPIIEKTIHSPTESYTTKYYYPQDLASPTAAELALIADYRIGIPVKTETLKNTDLVSTQYTVFNNTSWPSRILPEKVQTVHGTPGPSNPFTDQVIFHGYDTKGNPLEVSQIDGVHTTYIWGYDTTYPVAKVINATALEVATVLGSDLTLINGNTLTNTEIKTKINNLRTHASMSDALVFTYVYKIGYGVTSIVDPNGLESTYTYDDFGRLSEVRDHDGNLLQETTYQYKGE